MEKENLLKSIKTYADSHAIKSKNIYLLDDIDSKLLDIHRKNYASQMGSDEQPLLVVNKSIPGTVGGYGWSGLLVTDKKIYYKCIKDSFWSGLVVLSDKGEFSLDQIHSVSIGDHDHCFGTAYIGHQLLVNGKNLGLLRMGGGMEWDEKAIEELNIIFSRTI